MTFMHRFRLCVSVVSIVAAAHGAQAQLIAACGDTLTTGVYILDGDILDCDQAPALNLEGDAQLDMRGHRLSCSDDSFNGIVLGGEGNVVMNGVVSNCGHGVLAGAEGGHVVKNLEVRDCSGNGVRLLVDGNQLSGLYLHDNDGDQLYITGDGNKVVRVDIRDGNAHGAYVRGDKNKFIDCSAVNSSDHGFFVELSVGNSFTRCIAGDNGSDGFHLVGDKSKITSCTTFSNGDDGISVDGSGNKVTKSTSLNDGYGIALGIDDTCTKCVVSGSRVVGGGGHGIHLAGVGATASKNEIKGGTTGMNIMGGMPDVGGPTASKNLVVGSGEQGIRVFSDEATISDNIVFGASVVDVIDENPTCATNTWSGNLFVTSASGCEE